MNTTTTVIFAIIPTDEIKLFSIIITVTLSDISVEDENVELSLENSEIVFRYCLVFSSMIQVRK